MLILEKTEKIADLRKSIKKVLEKTASVRVFYNYIIVLLTQARTDRKSLENLLEADSDLISTVSFEKKEILIDQMITVDNLIRQVAMKVL